MLGGGLDWAPSKVYFLEKVRKSFDPGKVVRKSCYMVLRFSIEGLACIHQRSTLHTFILGRTNDVECRHQGQGTKTSQGWPPPLSRELHELRPQCHCRFWRRSQQFCLGRWEGGQTREKNQKAEVHVPSAKS